MAVFQKKIKLASWQASKIYEKACLAVQDLEKSISTVSFQVNYFDKEFLMKINSQLFSGTITCHDECLILNFQLSFLARAFAPQLEALVQKWIKKYFV